MAAIFNDRRKPGGQVFEFQPQGMDSYDPKPYHPAAGTPVRLSNKSGVGQLKGPYRYVEHATTGEFHGMVLKSSLRPRGKKPRNDLPGSTVERQVRHRSVLETRGVGEGLKGYPQKKDKP
jgi:hypothetical protein